MGWGCQAICKGKLCRTTATRTSHVGLAHGSQANITLYMQNTAAVAEYEKSATYADTNAARRLQYGYGWPTPSITWLR